MRRLPLLALAVGLLAMAAAGGLLRIGWPLSAGWAAAGAHHGALMVGGFFGALISLERAVALRSRWAYAAPLLAVAGGTCLAAGVSLQAGQFLLAAASAVLAVASSVVVVRQTALFTAVIAAGAGAWLAGNLLWAAGAPIEVVLPWWIGFFVLTIVGERLELSRVLPKPRRADVWLVALLAAAAAALAAQSVAGFDATGTAPSAALAWAAFGGTLAGLAAWLLRWDIARRTVHAQGLTRYMAVALLCGYVWLAVGGVLLAVDAAAQAWVAAQQIDAAWSAAAWPVASLADVFLRDAWLHALLVGFVFSMVFAHAFVILPSVAGVRLAWRPFAYGPLLLLHAGVVVRVAGDLAGAADMRRVGGLLNAAGLGALALTVAACAVAARRTRAHG